MKLVELMESPIEDITMVGDWSKNSSFRNEQDRKLLQNPKAIQKIKMQWAKTSVPFNIYFVNSPEGRKWTEVGAVDQNWLETNMPKTLPHLDIRPDSINVIFTNNNGDERVPMTGWIMAHRLSHALSRYGAWENWSMKKQFPEVSEIETEIANHARTILTMLFDYRPKDKRWLSSQDDIVLTRLFEAIGTFRSARSGNLRNEGEFLHELFAQYLLTGKIKFNPIPEMIKYGHIQYWNHGTEIDNRYYNFGLEDMAEFCENTFETLLSRAVGKVLVM